MSLPSPVQTGMRVTASHMSATFSAIVKIKMTVADNNGDGVVFRCHQLLGDRFARKNSR